MRSLCVYVQLNVRPPPTPRSPDGRVFPLVTKYNYNAGRSRVSELLGPISGYDIKHQSN